VANNPQLAYETVNAQADALGRLEDNGYIRIYSGTPPTRANDALSGNTLLAELRFSATSAPAASNGVLTSNTITSDSSADASGTPSFFRAFKSDGTSVTRQGTAGASGCDLNLVASTITAGLPVNITSLTHTVVRGA
jgi:hypothetical protein